MAAAVLSGKMDAVGGCSSNKRQCREHLFKVCQEAEKTAKPKDYAKIKRTLGFEMLLYTG